MNFLPIGFMFGQKVVAMSWPTTATGRRYSFSV
jgi:hypothetical protein